MHCQPLQGCTQRIPVDGVAQTSAPFTGHARRQWQDRPQLQHPAIVQVHIALVRQALPHRGPPWCDGSHASPMMSSARAAPSKAGAAPGSITQQGIDAR